MLYDALFVPHGEKSFPMTTVDLPEISKYVDNWGKPGDFGIIVQQNEELIGAVWGRLFCEDNKGYGFVSNDTPELTMAIKSKYRNQGIGVKLLPKFFIVAEENGYKNISLSVDKRNRAFDFYKRMGFEIVDELETAYTMKREINNVT